MVEFAVFNRRIYTGTVSILPYASRLAWGVVLFEAEKLRGKAKLPVYDLARMAAITVDEAAEALRLFQEPDAHSSSKVEEGRRLRPVYGEEDWYEIINWQKHLDERDVFFNRLRQQRFKDKARLQVTPSNAGNANKRSVTKEPKLEPEPKELLRGEESKTKTSVAGAPVKKSAKELVEEFVVDEDTRAYARRFGVDADAHLDEWRDHFRGNGYKTGRNPIANAQATFRGWLRRVADRSVTPSSLFAGRKRVVEGNPRVIIPAPPPGED